MADPFGDGRGHTKSSRRQFLRSAGGAAVALKLSAFVEAARADEPAHPLAGDNGKTRRSDVLIIGAGAAGLGAARKLTDAGKSVIVIEARDRTGGRVWTNRTWSDVPVDLGASWIHGHLGNPMTELAERYDVKTKVTDFNSIAAFDDQGKPLGAQEIARILKASGDLHKGLRQLEGEFSRAGPAPISLNEAIRRTQQSAAVSDEDRAWQRRVARGQIEVEFAADLDELGFPGWNAGQEFAGQQRIFPNGYGGILDGLAEGLDIRLQTAASEIDYSAVPVKIHTTGGTFEAERIVVTLPLGVLKSGAVRFTPDLPESKRAAVWRLGMGLLDKVFLRFDETFWPERDILAFLGDRAQQWPALFNLQRVTGQPVLVAFKGGRSARADEQQSDTTLVARLLEQLRGAFGPRVAQPVARHITRWAGDPHSLGSYSYIRVGSSPDDRDQLSEPLGDRLFFAGEATHRDHSATVHGAYLSGLREADRVLAV